MNATLFRADCLHVRNLCYGYRIVEAVRAFQTNSAHSRAWLLMALVLTGCGAEKESLFEEDHAVPAHWPSSLMDAAEKIDQRLAQLADKSSTSLEATGQTEPQQTRSVSCESELRDLVAWIPEVVADTDLTEQQWLPVFELCEVMRVHLSNSDVSALDIEEDFRKLQELLRKSSKLLPTPAEASALQASENADLDSSDAIEIKALPTKSNAGDNS